MATPRFDAPAIIIAYRKAYRLANGKNAPSVTYNSGWFCMTDELGPSSYRRRALQAMTKRLLERTPSTPNGESTDA